LNLYFLVRRRKMVNLIEVFKILYSIEKHWWIINNKSAWRDCKLFKSYSKTLRRRKCFSQRVISNWNSLPQHVVEPQHVVDSNLLNFLKKHLHHHIDTLDGEDMDNKSWTAYISQLWWWWWHCILNYTNDWRLCFAIH